jgi:Histidine phosphatase superfamily (branch 1)
VLDGRRPVLDAFTQARRAWADLLAAPGTAHLVVTHKSLLRALLCTALGLPPAQFRAIDIGNGAVCMLRCGTGLCGAGCWRGAHRVVWCRVLEGSTQDAGELGQLGTSCTCRAYVAPGCWGRQDECRGSVQVRASKPRQTHRLRHIMHRCSARGELMLSALNLTAHLLHPEVRYALPQLNKNDALALELK